MTKTSKSERKWGTDVDKKPPKKRNTQLDKTGKPEVEFYKIMVDNSGFSQAMSYDDCMKVIGEMEAKAIKLRRNVPSLILVKQ